MAETCQSTKKGCFQATVISNRQIGPCFWKVQLRFTGPGAVAFGAFRPGQFFQMDTADLALPPQEEIPEALRDGAHRNVLLRRPFSFAEVTVKKEAVTAELLYCVVGPATLRMTTLRRDDPVSIVGPLGNGFWVPEGKHTALLVVGGMGLPPIQCLAKALTAEFADIEAYAFVGAKTAKALPFEGHMDQVSEQLGFCIPAFAAFGIEAAVATDDGSAGFNGVVTDLLVQWLENHHERQSKETIIYACGPEPMLAGVAKLAKDKQIDCQVSMERRMACGIGLCQSCAIQCKGHKGGEPIYRLCCQDGPVFDAQEIVWDV